MNATQIAASNSTNFVTQVFGYIDGVEFLLGFAFNSFVVVVCLQPKLRKTSNFIFIAFSSISGMFIVLFHGLPSFLNQVLGITIELTSLTWCRAYLYFDLVFYNSSAWYLVSWIFSTY